MNKETALEYLDLVISDCDHGPMCSQNWDSHSWEAMGDLLSQVREFIMKTVQENKDDQQTNGQAEGITNPESDGGEFAAVV